jgi:signal transduction histidine kinase
MFNSGLRADKKNALILIVDDDQTARLLLKWMLEQEGYTILEAENGQEALSVCHYNQPDLILLDAMMPLLDGFETCRQLRQIPFTEQLPILMVTALEDTISVEKAFEVGATDYITKPVHWPVLRHRVHRLLAHQEAEKMRENLTNMIVHDMKTPLGAITGLGGLLLEGHVGSFSEEQFDIIQRMVRNGQNLLEMTATILDVARLREGKLDLELRKMPVIEMFMQITDEIKYLALQRNITLQVDAPPLGAATYDWNLLRRVIINLLTNAIKHSPTGSTIWLSARQQTNIGWVIMVKDEGEGIDLPDQTRIFEPFTQAKNRKGGWNNDSGLGLTFCKLVVEAHGGKIEVDSDLNAGTTFRLMLPENALKVKDDFSIKVT